MIISSFQEDNHNDVEGTFGLNLKDRFLGGGGDYENVNFKSTSLWSTSGH